VEIQKSSTNCLVYGWVDIKRTKKHSVIFAVFNIWSFLKLHFNKRFDNNTLGTASNTRLELMTAILKRSKEDLSESNQVLTAINEQLP